MHSDEASQIGKTKTWRYRLTVHVRPGIHHAYMATTIENEIELAEQEAAATVDVRTALRALPLASRRGVLLRELATMKLEASEPPAPAASTVVAPSSTENGAASSPHTTWRVTLPIDNGTDAEKKAGSPGTGTRRLYVFVKAHPLTPIAEIAAALYGDASDESRNKVRSFMAVLKKKGLVTSASIGSWEAVPEK